MARKLDEPATWRLCYHTLLLLMILMVDVTNGGLIIYVDNSAPDRTNSSMCWEQNVIHGPCATLELGLEGIQSALSKGHIGDYTLLIAGGTYQLSQSDQSQFISIYNLTIQGYQKDFNGTDQATINCSTPSGGVGLSFINSSNITLNNIVFDGCGQLRNSSSFNLNHLYPAYVQFIVSLYFLYCRDVTLERVTVQNTLGMGTIIYNTNGEVSIGNCSFVNNRYQPDSGQSGGGGLYIEFSYCDPLNRTCLLDGNSNVDTQYTKDANYTIVNTVFHSNRANISQSNVTAGTYILPFGIYHNAFGRGGGVSVYVIGKATNVGVSFDNCSFVNNSALWGAGMLVEFHDNAYHNYVFVKNSHFSGNYLYYNSRLTSGTGGGGVRIAMFMFPNNGSYIYDNNVIFTSCNLTSNSAYYGGGFSYYTTLQSQQYKTNHLQLFSCNFSLNTARLGSAIDLSIFHPSTQGVFPSIELRDVLFSRNKALYHNRQGAPVGIGAVYIDTLCIEFAGNVTFDGNLGSALVLSGCHIDVLNDANVLFANNLARSGGGIVLYAGSYIITHPGSFMSFVNNTAEYYGGAIYNYNSGVRDQFGSGNCFLRFSNIFTSPDKWTSRFYFEANSANGMGNAIYTATVLPCVWGSAHGTTNSSDSNIQKVFCWGSNWEYRNLSNDSVICHEQISTAPSRYNLTESYSLIPGQTVPLRVKVWDDMSNVVTERTVFILKVINYSDASFPGKEGYNYSYVSHGQLSLVGTPNSHVTLQVETDNPIILESQINVTLRPCPPGFYAVPSEGSGQLKCICDQNYKGYIRCNQSNFSSSIFRTGWIGTVSGLGDNLVFGTSPYIHSSKQYVPLPQDPKELPHFFCGPSNSRGILCGGCKDGYGVSADFLESSCTICSPGSERYTWIFYLLTEFLPVTVFFGIVFLFSMTVTFGPLNSYIFFAQVITTVVKVDADGEVYAPEGSTNAMQSAYMIPYAVWNLNFFRTVLPHYCIHSNWNTLTVLNIGYLQVVYLIVLMLLLFAIMNLYGRGIPVIVRLFRPFHRCLARFRQWTNLRQSVTGGMAVFVVIAYTKSVVLALYILTPVQLIYPNGTIATAVFYLDGDVKFDAGNIRYMIPSLIVLAFAAIPPVLLAYPTLLGLLWRLSCKRLPLARLYPSHKLQAFLDEFHGCYKNGSDGGLDCRWFASLYFCLRIALITVFTTSYSYMDQFTIQGVFFIAIAVLFLVFQPYRKSWLNQLDAVMFLLMATISSLSTFNLTRVQSDKPPNMAVFTFQYILIFVPLVYCICYYMTLFCIKNRTRWFQHRTAKSPVTIQEPALTTSTASSREESYQSALVDSTHVPNFLDFVENAGRMRQNVRLINPQNWNARDIQTRGESDRLVPSNESQRGSTNPTPSLLDTVENYDSTGELSNEDLTQ